jgi:peptidoglycan hydrolase CwlO-like protein
MVLEQAQCPVSMGQRAVAERLDHLASIPEDVRSVQGDVRSVQGDVRSVQGDVQTVRSEMKILGETVATLRNELAAGFKAMALQQGGV